jgi:hypothetical protein
MRLTDRSSTSRRSGPIRRPIRSCLPVERRSTAFGVGRTEAARDAAARLRAGACGEAGAESARRGTQIDQQPPPLTNVLRRSRLVVHNGGSGLASAALAAGVPQLVLSTHVEQNLAGEALERASVAGLVRIV